MCRQMEASEAGVKCWVWAAGAQTSKLLTSLAAAVAVVQVVAVAQIVAPPPHAL